MLRPMFMSLYSSKALKSAFKGLMYPNARRHSLQLKLSMRLGSRLIKQTFSPFSAGRGKVDKGLTETNGKMRRYQKLTKGPSTVRSKTLKTMVFKPKALKPKALRRLISYKTPTMQHSRTVKNRSLLGTLKPLRLRDEATPFLAFRSHEVLRRQLSDLIFPLSLGNLKPLYQIYRPSFTQTYPLVFFCLQTASLGAVSLLSAAAANVTTPNLMFTLNSFHLRSHSTLLSSGSIERGLSPSSQARKVPKFFPTYYEFIQLSRHFSSSFRKKSIYSTFFTYSTVQNRNLLTLDRFSRPLTLSRKLSKFSRLPSSLPRSFLIQPLFNHSDNLFELFVDAISTTPSTASHPFVGMKRRLLTTRSLSERRVDGNSLTSLAQLGSIVAPKSLTLPQLPQLPLLHNLLNITASET